MICENCKAELKEGVRFCPRCGSKVEERTVAGEGGRKCPLCGAENPSTAKFCKVDGTPLTDTGPVKEPPLAGVPPSPAAPSEAPERVVGPPLPPIEVSEKAEGKERSSKMWLWILIVIVVVLGGGGYYYFAQEQHGPLGEVPAEPQAEKTESVRQPPPGPPPAAGPEVAETREKLSRVVSGLNSVKGAVVIYYEGRKHLTEASGQAAIRDTYGVVIPDDYAIFSVDRSGKVTATARNVFPAVDGKTITLIPDAGMKSWRMSSSIDPQYLPAQ